MPTWSAPAGLPFNSPEASSEDLTHHHRRHGRKQGDAESGEWVLTLGDGHAGDHAGADAGDGQLGEQFTAGAGAGGHRGTNNWLDGKGKKTAAPSRNPALLPGVGVRYLPQSAGGSGPAAASPLAQLLQLFAGRAR